jgi:hypothetical protein
MLKYHIQTIEVGSGGAGSIAFNNIPQTFDDLELVISSRNTGANTERDIFLQFNGSSSNYSVRRLYGDGGSAFSDVFTSGADALRIGFASGTNQTANTFGSIKVTISNYTRPTVKSVSSDSVTENNATRALQSIHAGLWNDTSAINSLTLQLILSQVFAQHSSASLYGIRRGSDGRTEVASGGVITQSGGFTIHTFNSSGTFVANRNLNVDYLVIAGGGGGGHGGGGAGGYRCSVAGESSGGGTPALSPVPVTAGVSYAVIVGAGGPNSFGITVAGNSGTASQFAGVVASGGGRGGSVNNPDSDLVGGSGGGSGGSGGSTNGSAGISGQGFAGGNYVRDANSNQMSAGGGGAGGAGSNNSGLASGAGGAGLSSSITGSAVARAGGGGGGQVSTNAPGSATAGGGAGSWSSTVGNPGTANTGGGGGGAGFDIAGGNGGSGVVIIRYLTP